MNYTTIGVKFGWAVETEKGVKPTAFKQVLNCKDIGSIDLSTDTIDTTPLESKSRRYAKGLADTGGEWNVTFGWDDDFVDAWNEVLEASKTGRANSLQTWFVVWVPDSKNSFYVIAEPGEIPMSGMSVSSPIEVEISNTINEYHGMDMAIEPTEPIMSKATAELLADEDSKLNKEKTTF